MASYALYTTLLFPWRQATNYWPCPLPFGKIKHAKKSLIQQGHCNAVAVEHTKEINIQKGNKEHEGDHRNKLSTNETEH